MFLAISHSGFLALSTHKFEQCEPCLNVAHNDNYLCVKWYNANIVFSYARRGNALCCHFAADKKSLRKIKNAISDFCEWAFDEYRWCDMLLAFVEKKSVGRLISKLEFVPIYTVENSIIYARGKDGQFS
jgi:hypothetical protein